MKSFSLARSSNGFFSPFAFPRALTMSTIRLQSGLRKLNFDVVGSFLAFSPCIGIALVGIPFQSADSLS